MKNVLGIISYDDSSVHVSGLDEFRPIPSLSFLGRYRLIDFAMSNFTNSGIKDIQVFVKNKPRSVIEHLGSGRQYNINSKHGRLRILTGEEVVHSELYNHDVNGYLQNMLFIENHSADTVVIAPSHMIYTVNFKEVLDAHRESKADVTVLYKTVDNANERFLETDTLTLDTHKRVLDIEKNRGKYKNRHISLSAYVMSKELFIALVHLADNLSSVYSLKDVLQEQIKEIVMVGYPVHGYVACINSLNAYYESNLELLDAKVSSTLFNRNWPIHTRTNDSCPARYTKDAVVQNAMVSNGCVIEGEVINSVVGRGVMVKKGARIVNSIVLAGSVVGENIHLERVIVDKEAEISKAKHLSGTDQPMYVKRNDRV